MAVKGTYLAISSYLRVLVEMENLRTGTNLSWGVTILLSLSVTFIASILCLKITIKEITLYFIPETMPTFVVFY